MLIPVFDELKTLMRASGLPLAYVSHRSGVHRATLSDWLTGKTGSPRLDTMLKVATVLGLHLELTQRLTKMVAYYPRREPRSPPVIPFAGKRKAMSRHQVRMTLAKLQ